MKTRRRGCPNEGETARWLCTGSTTRCELRSVRARPEERVQSHHVAPGRPERLGRNPVQIATVDAAVKTVTSRLPLEEQDDERLWGCSTMRYELLCVRARPAERVQSHDPLSCRRRTRIVRSSSAISDRSDICVRSAISAEAAFASGAPMNLPPAYADGGVRSAICQFVWERTSARTAVAVPAGGGSVRCARR